jgi:rRNA-processing protein FCF1
VLIRTADHKNTSSPFFSKTKKIFKRYFVATQDKDLRLALSNLPGVPLVYINKVILVLEPPSSTSKAFAKQVIKIETYS